MACQPGYGALWGEERLLTLSNRLIEGLSVVPESAGRNRETSDITRSLLGQSTVRRPATRPTDIF